MRFQEVILIKKKKEITKKADELGITDIFYCQYLYKTLTGFVNAYGSKRFKQACESVKMRFEEIRDDYLKFGYIDTDFATVNQTLKRIDEILK